MIVNLRQAISIGRVIVSQKFRRYLGKMSPKNGAIIILDIGRNVSTPEEIDEKSFFEQARECAIRLIEQKIISQGKDLLGVILLGSHRTKNAMAKEGAFRQIEMYSNLVTPTWNMIWQLPDTPSQSKGDWVDAIIVAINHFKKCSGVYIENKKIILMTNFKVPTANYPKDVQLILKELKDDNYEVDVIGPDLFNVTKADIQLAQQFVKATNGTTATFEYTMRYLLFHNKKDVCSKPWNVELSIGPNIKIPILSYIRLKDDTVVKTWNEVVKCPVKGVVKNKFFVNAKNNTKLQKNNPPIRGYQYKEVVHNKFYVNADKHKPMRQKNSKPVRGYQYGQRVIPFTEVKKSMQYEGGDKCLSVYGFTDASNITWQNLNGEGLHYLFGRKGDKKAQEAIRCLVECLHEMNLVGIVRRVYNWKNAPKMLVLFPVIDKNNFVCLSMAPICFKEDIKFMSFPATNLKKFNCSDAQVKGFVDLIKAMDLTRAYDDTFDYAEAFPVGETVSPFAQHMLDCIAFRAMHPNEPLPQPRDDIMNLFKMPPLIEKRSRKPMKKLKSLFKLNKASKQKVWYLSEPSSVIESAENMGASYKPEMVKIELPVQPTNEIKRIGTLNPIGDYTALKANEKPMANLAEEMTAALESMINGNLDGNYTKAFDAMLFFRKECVDSNPSYYNNWLKTFKEMLNYRNNHDIVRMISEKNADFLVKSENNLNDYDTMDSHDESQFFENNTVPDSIELTLKTEDDMFAYF